MERARQLYPGFRALVSVAILALTGCGDFFVPPDNSGGGGGGTGTARVYVANATTGSISGFTIGTDKLTAVPNSPVSLGFAPLAVVVSPNNAYLYVASSSSISVYAINSDGSLTAKQNGAVISVASLDISPDGQWLFGLDRNQNALDEFKIDTSSGGITPFATPGYDALTGTILPAAVKVSPLGNLVFCALGTGGERVFTLDTTSGSLSYSQGLALGVSTTSDNALAVDSTGSYLYVARSGTNGGLAVYTIGAGGALNSIAGSPFAAGERPSSVTLDKTGKYIYVANRTDSTVSGYSIGTGSALTAISGSPFGSGQQVNALGIDPGGKYLLAGANNGGPDLSMYGFDATTAGKLNLSTSIATDTDPAGVTAIAVTH
ncbi:beta-propeller fold lactonase family protein [Edaphobacter sp. HDX4]|uniref:lactonase family protein n=1 Tax=Edaphobacter sp. HDX4 TaxID=2794064 RepID=UPI002FE68868